MNNSTVAKIGIAVGVLAAVGYYWLNQLPIRVLLATNAQGAQIQQWAQEYSSASKVNTSCNVAKNDLQDILFIPRPLADMDGVREASVGSPVVTDNYVIFVSGASPWYRRGRAQALLAALPVDLLSQLEPVDTTGFDFDKAVRFDLYNCKGCGRCNCPNGNSCPPVCASYGIRPPDPPSASVSQIQVSR